MPLKEGDLPYMPFTARINPTPYPSGGCPQSPADLVKWFGSFTVDVNFDGVAFGYTAGKLSAVTPSDRTMPRAMFDDQGRFMGFAIWDDNLGGWTVGAAVGEMKTIVRTEGTLAADMAAKGIGAGWYLCDGSKAPLPDLTLVDGFFQGTGPNWSTYTVGYLGI